MMMSLALLVPLVSSDCHCKVDRPYSDGRPSGYTCRYVDESGIGTADSSCCDAFNKYGRPANETYGPGHWNEDHSVYHCRYGSRNAYDGCPCRMGPDLPRGRPADQRNVTVPWASARSRWSTLMDAGEVLFNSSTSLAEKSVQLEGLAPAMVALAAALATLSACVLLCCVAALCATRVRMARRMRELDERLRLVTASCEVAAFDEADTARGKRRAGGELGDPLAGVKLSDGLLPS